MCVCVGGGDGKMIILQPTQEHQESWKKNPYYKPTETDNCAYIKIFTYSVLSSEEIYKGGLPSYI